MAEKPELLKKLIHFNVVCRKCGDDKIKVEPILYGHGDDVSARFTCPDCGMVEEVES